MHSWGPRTRWVRHHKCHKLIPRVPYKPQTLNCLNSKLFSTAMKKTIKKLKGFYCSHFVFSCLYGYFEKKTILKKEKHLRPDLFAWLSKKLIFHVFVNVPDFIFTAFICQKIRCISGGDHKRSGYVQYVPVI